VVIVADTCFGGGLVTSVAASRAKTFSAYPEKPASPMTSDLHDGFVQDIRESGRVILMASGENESSLETTSLGHGVFSYFMLEALRSESADQNHNGWISAEEAFAYLRPKVQTFANGDQNPVMLDGVAGHADLVSVRVQPEPCPFWE
jgi:uncharacterized caspase-like protein